MTLPAPVKERDEQEDQEPDGADGEDDQRLGRSGRIPEHLEEIEEVPLRSRDVAHRIRIRLRLEWSPDGDGGNVGKTRHRYLHFRFFPGRLPPRLYRYWHNRITAWPLQAMSTAIRFLQ